MWTEHAAQRFRTLLKSLNQLATRKDAAGQARRSAVEGEAAKIGLELEEQLSKGRPKHTDNA